jgi:hypothetical protein
MRSVRRRSVPIDPRAGMSNRRGVVFRSGGEAQVGLVARLMLNLSLNVDLCLDRNLNLSLSLSLR